MKIVFLDGYTINPGDLNWKPLETFGELTVYDRTTADEVLERARGAEVLIVNKTPLTRTHFHALKDLKLVCVAATGYDKINVAAARECGVTVCNCAGYSTKIVAQLATSLVLEAADCVGAYTWRNRQGEWSRSADFCYTAQPRLELDGKRMAIVGFGNIGNALAQIMLSLGLKVFAVTSRPAKQLPEEITKISLEDAFKTCDIVSLNCPLNADNKEFVNAELLARSNPNLILVNTARGGLINEQDVAEALHNGKLGAYCTDVLTTEPPTADNPILNAPHTFVTPHIGWNTREARQRIMGILAENIHSFETGNPQNVIN